MSSVESSCLLLRAEPAVTRLFWVKSWPGFLLFWTPLIPGIAVVDTACI